MKTNAAPDALPATKYPLLLNARSYSDDEIRCRPGMNLLFNTASGDDVLNICGFSNGQGIIRYLAAVDGSIYRDDNTTPVDSSFDPTSTQSMIPYRPNQSVLPWMYIGDNQSYRKFSLPVGSAALLDQKVGIAEPQSPVDASLTAGFVSAIGLPWGVSPTITNAGVASSVSNGARTTDTMTVFFADPAISAIQYSVVSNSPSQQYQRGMLLVLGGADAEVLDVITPCATAIAIAGIYYYSGTSGKCVIVPGNIAQGAGNEGQSFYQQQVLSTLRRGAIITIGSEACLVLTVSIGLNGQISFETSTTGTYTSSNSFTINGSITTYNSGSSGAITSQDYVFSITGAGIGTVTLSGLSGSALISSLRLFQDDDYLHFSVLVGDLGSLNEMKFLLDIGDGSFTENFLFYAVRPSDITAAVSNTLTQLGAAQIYAQRATIEEEDSAKGVAPGVQTPPGTDQWADIFIPIKQLVRVGSDQSKTLLNLNAVQILINASAAIPIIAFNSIDFRGGFQTDVGQQGAPYRYRIRPRSTVTGAKGNPSPDMRYGVSPRRDQTTVILPGTAYDPQFNTWDVFRLGGVLTDWTFAGTVPIGAGNFIDIYDDLSISGGEILDFDNLEPWPSIDVPLAGTASVVGTSAVFTPAAGSSSLIGNYLPGNKVLVAQQAFTLWNRPVYSAGTWLFQFQENAGVYAGGTICNIYEPLVANQQLPYIWGPSDQGGVLFGGGDPLRPGTVSFCKNFNPDSVPDNYNLELTAPSEPIIGGIYAAGRSWAFSSARVFPLRPSFGQANQWTPETPLGPGLASSFGICTDGRNVFYVADDGIRMISQGSVNLTEADLSNIFPRDGVQALNVSYRGVFYPPNFSLAAQFRLCHCAGYIYFDFIDYSNTWQTLVFDIARKAWSLDQYGNGVHIHVAVVQAPTQAGISYTAPQTLVMGDQTGKVYVQADGVSDAGTAINFRVITAEEIGGEDRANKQWGDAFVSLLPSKNSLTTITACSGGADLSANVTVSGTARVPVILNTGNPILFSLGLDISCTQTFASGETAATLYIWQPAYIPQPVTEQARFTDWEDGPFPGNGFWQGFLLEANTNGQNKTLLVRDADTLATHAFTPYPMNFAQQSRQAFSFTNPFIAHSVRREPQDDVNWNQWDISWFKIPYPEAAETWSTEGQTHGLRGYQSVFQANLAYIATATVTLTITTDTGQTVTQTFAATGAQLAPVKILAKLPVNKGKVFAYSLTSTAPFYVWKELSEVWCGEWGRTSEFAKRPLFGGPSQEGAEV
jgi:hypothetical protein